MAHQKMMLYPMLLLSLYLVISRRDIREFGAPLLGGFVTMPIVIAVFFAYWLFVRHEILVVDIVIYIASIVGAVLLARRWRTKPFVQRNWPLWIVLTVIAVVATGFLTYHSPDWIVFADLGE